MITPYELSPESRPSQIKTVTTPASSRKQVVFTLTDGQGTPVDLFSELETAGVPLPDLDPLPTLSAVSARIILRAVSGLEDNQLAFEVEGELYDTTSQVAFNLTSDHTACPGIYTAEVGLFAEDDLVRTWPVRIHIERSVFGTRYASGPLSVPEVRLAFNDLEHTEESLLDDLEFTDDQILGAARRVISLWNETVPVIVQMTPATFPWREWWLRGTMSYLYEMAAAKYRRDDIAFSAGGLSFDDKNKSAEYQRMAELYRNEFMQWMLQTKRSYNMNLCWSVGI